MITRGSSWFLWQPHRWHGSAQIQMGVASIWYRLDGNYGVGVSLGLGSDSMFSFALVCSYVNLQYISFNEAGHMLKGAAV
jgi:hypothetical protein